MSHHRYYGRVLHVTSAGGTVLERDDGGGRVYAPSRETALTDDALGARVEFTIRPGGEGRDIDVLD